MMNDDKQQLKAEQRQAASAAADAAVVVRRAALKQKREQVTAALGVSIAKDVEAFKNGTLYVQTIVPSIVAWLIDAAVIVGVPAVLATAYYQANVYESDVNTGAVLIFIAVFLVMPFVYGLAYSNGRALGGLITGTRLVQGKDGQKIGLFKAGWAMFARFWVIVNAILDALNGQNAAGLYDGFPTRVSINSKATERLHAAGFTTLDT